MLFIIIFIRNNSIYNVLLFFLKISQYVVQDYFYKEYINRQFIIIFIRNRSIYYVLLFFIKNMSLCNILLGIFITNKSIYDA